MKHPILEMFSMAKLGCWLDLTLAWFDFGCSVNRTPCACSAANFSEMSNIDRFVRHGKWQIVPITAPPSAIIGD